MARPIRIEYAGALYHVTARGNAQGDIYNSDKDRTAFLSLLKNSCERHQWRCHAYCLMNNHYHLLIETLAPTLSKGMKYLNGTYTQQFNRRHGRAGHVFQGRYKAILVEKDRYLLELCRYIVLNPVRAQMVRSVRDWRWSSYRATAGMAKPTEGLTIDWVLGHFGKQRKRAINAYKGFVREGKNQPSPWDNLRNQVYLGSDDFIEYAQSQMTDEQSLEDIPKSQILAPIKPLAHYVKRYSRKEGMARAYLSGHYSLAKVGEAYGVSYATVSRAVKAWETMPTPGN